MDIETKCVVACSDCGGAGHGPDQVDGPGDVYQGKCPHCGGTGIEPTVAPTEPEPVLTCTAVERAYLDARREYDSIRSRRTRTTLDEAARDLNAAYAAPVLS